MGYRRNRVGWLGLLAGVLWAAVATAGAQEPAGPGWASTPVPLEQLPPPVRERVLQVMERPTFHAVGPAESFLCHPEHYHWLLEHPDRAVTAWRRLGAKCVDIQDRGNGRFGWSDTLGSDLGWSTVYRDGNLRVWYAEGHVRPGSVLPLLPVRAVVVLRYAELVDQANQAFLRQQAELFLFTDSRTAALVARLIGASAPKLGQQYVAQLEMFYSALAWYIREHPEYTDALFSDRSDAGPLPPGYRPRLPTLTGPPPYRMDGTGE